MRFPYSIWLETGRKGVVDGEVDLGLSPAAMAASVLLVRVLEGGGGVARELLRVGVVLLVPLAGVKRLCNGGATARPSGGGTGAPWRCGGWCYDAGKQNWTGGGVPVGHGGALVAMDRSSETMWAADDGGQWWRRRSGEARGRK
jgi:hypothetical protein